MSNLRERLGLATRILLNRQEKAGVIVRWPDWMNEQAQWQMVNLDAYVNEGFDANSLIYSCIMYKVHAVSAVMMRAYTGERDHPKLVKPDHPLARLVARPNLHQSWIEFAGQNIVYLNVSGNIYIYLDRPKPGALPTAMMSLRPDRVKIIPKDGKTLGYKYFPTPTSEGVPILAEDMIHIKLPNPGDELEGMGYGLSPISPGARSADVDNSVTDFLKIFFDRGTMVGGVLSYETKLSEEQVARARANWKEKYGGPEAWATEVAVLDSGGKYTPITMDFSKMGFKEIDERNETRTAMPFGVPLILVGSRYGLQQSTYSNYEEARRAFWEDTFTYELRLIETDMQFYLQSEDGAWIANDLSDVPALRQNILPLIDGAYKLWTMGVPANMAVDTVGLEMEEIPGGDIGYLPMGVSPVGSDPALPAGNPADSGVGEDVTEDERVEDAKRRLGKKKSPVFSPLGIGRLPRANVSRK